MKMDIFTDRDLLERKVMESKSREDLEKYLIAGLEAMFKVYRAYNPNGTYLSLTVIGNEESEEGLYYSAKNDYTNEDFDKPLNTYKLVVGEKE